MTTLPICQQLRDPGQAVMVADHAADVIEAMHEAVDRIFSYVSYINIHGVGEQPEPSEDGSPQIMHCPPDEFWRIFQDIGKRAAEAAAKAEGRSP